MKRLKIFAPFLFSFFFLAIDGARADQIDGTWCSPAGKSMTIKGPQVVTPGGKTIEGRYTRHHFDYTVPTGEKHAGDVVNADQINDETIQVTLIRGSDRVRDKPVIWNRCDVVS